MPWIIVIADRDSVAWVVKNKKMAVNPRVRTLPDVGDDIVLYVTRGAFRNPTSDQGRFFGVGTVSGRPVRKPVEVGTRSYSSYFPIKVDTIDDPRTNGMPIAGLIERLDFIKRKDQWGGSLRRPLVRIEDADFKLIAGRLRAHMQRVP